MKHPRSGPLAALVVGLLLAAVLTGCSGPDDSSPPSTAEIAQALRQHATAVRDHDRSAFLAGVSDAPRAASFRAAQRAEFANLRHLPLARWTYSLAAPVHAAAAQSAARARFGPSARIVKVTLHVAIRGVDRLAAAHSLWWTVARAGGRVVICADDGLARQGGVSWHGPWDFGRLAVLRGVHSLVLGAPAATPDLRRIADVVDRAVPAVTAIWGTNWSRDVLVVVPSSTAAREAALGESTAGETSEDSGEQADDVAVTVSDGQDPLTRQPEGQRVVVEQRAFDGLSAIGRRIVFTHEITHVASAAATGGASPRWLVEGLAEYVANLHTGLAVGTAASELVTQIRRDGLPTSLPGDDSFDAASTAAASYEQAWLACRLIAAKAGPAGLVRVYRLVGSSGLSTQTAVREALRTVLHETSTQFTAQWRAYLAGRLG